MKTLLILLLIFCVILFPSCNRLKEGTVTRMWKEPANEYIQYMHITTYSNGSTYTQLVPYFVFDDEDWCIQIQGIYKNKKRVETVYISKQEYDKLSIGSRFIVKDDSCFYDNNNIKKPKN